MLQHFIESSLDLPCLSAGGHQASFSLSLSMNRHQPQHLYLENEIYFISSRIYDGHAYIRPEINKQIVLEIIGETTKTFGYSLYAFSILDNHYHILFGTKDNQHIDAYMQRVNGLSSYKINQRENARGRKMWQNYWDWCIRNERDFYQHFNYIHINPVKHGCVQDFEKLLQYKYCSYRYWEQKKGKEFLDDCFMQYPIADFETQEDKRLKS